MSGSSSAKGVKTNSKGESHCYNCGEPDHWAHGCPQLKAKQQQQLHMNLEYAEGIEEQQEEAHQLMHVTLAQGAALPNNRAYLDGCSTVTAFKSKKYLKGIKKQDAGIKINCNTGTVITDLMGKYGSINGWYIPKGIVIFFDARAREEVQNHLRQLAGTLRSAHAQRGSDIL
jgi:hypothetical protein